jgi:hypothetical protein
MKSKIYRCNCREIWSIQNRKSNTTANTVLLNGTWNTELKPERRSNPKGFVITNRSQNIIFNPAIELLEQFVRVAKLIYDKKNVDFNVKQGEYLYFAEDGNCFILKNLNVDRTVS